MTGKARPRQSCIASPSRPRFGRTGLRKASMSLWRCCGLCLTVVLSGQFSKENPELSFKYTFHRHAAYVLCGLSLRVKVCTWSGQQKITEKQISEGAPNISFRGLPMAACNQAL